MRRLPHEHSISNMSTKLNSIVCEVFSITWRYITLHRSLHASLSKMTDSEQNIYFWSLLKNSVTDRRYLVTLTAGPYRPWAGAQEMRNKVWSARFPPLKANQHWNDICHSQHEVTQSHGQLTPGLPDWASHHLVHGSPLGQEPNQKAM